MSLSLVWTVLHMFEYVVFLDTEPFLYSLQGVPEFHHSHQTSLGICEILVPGNPLLKSERTVQFSCVFDASELLKKV